MTFKSILEANVTIKRSVLPILLAALLVSCAQPNIVNTPNRGAEIQIVVPQERIDKTSGFWMGIWHGIVFPFALVGKAFGADIAVYDVVNNGNWYNFGFWLGLGFAINSASSTSKSEK